MRATLKPCSPSGKAQPMIKSSMPAGSTPLLSISPRTTSAAMSSGRFFTSWPLWAKWKGDLLYPAMTTGFMVSTSLNSMCVLDDALRICRRVSLGGLFGD